MMARRNEQGRYSRQEIGNGDLDRLGCRRCGRRRPERQLVATTRGVLCRRCALRLGED
jgi:hypothetical protein